MSTRSALRLGATRRTNTLIGELYNGGFNGWVFQCPSFTCKRGFAREDARGSSRHPWGARQGCANPKALSTQSQRASNARWTRLGAKRTSPRKVPQSLLPRCATARLRPAKAWLLVQRWSGIHPERHAILLLETWLGARLAQVNSAWLTALVAWSTRLAAIHHMAD